jgi:hypothetical protein
MPTHSLTLRNGHEGRLSIEEMDNNFLYLQELALSSSVIDLTNITTDVIPAEDSQYNLGSSASQWKSLHVSGQTIYLGGVPLSTDNGSLVINSINLGTTASPFILSSDDNNNLLLNGGGYKGFYAGINRLFGDDPTITQVVISKSPNASYQNKTKETDNEDFYVTGLSGSDTVVILNIYGADIKRPLKLKDIRKFVEKFIDIVLYTDKSLNTDLTVIKELFYDNIEVLTSSLPTGSLYKNFTFQDKDIEYSNVPFQTNSEAGSGTFSLYKSAYSSDGYYLSGEGGPSNNNNFTYGFQVNDIVTISGTALGGQSPENDATIYVTQTNDGVINTFEIYTAGAEYTDGYYNIYNLAWDGSSNGRAYAYITTNATGSVTGVELIDNGYNYEISAGEGFNIIGGDGNAMIEVTSIRNGVINGYKIIGTPDYRSPYRNSENPWPVMKIEDGGNDQYDTSNWITTDKSITKVIGSIESIQLNNGNYNILTVTEVISGTISVGQTIRHDQSNYEILTGTTDGGVGTYSISNFNTNDTSEQVFTVYGINYGGGEVVENNTFGTGSSYVTLYDESIFAMVAIGTDIDKVWYTGDSGSDGNTNSKKEVNVLIADNNTLSLGDTKVELSNKDLILPETETLGWMSIFGKLHNDYNDIEFRSSIIDNAGNTYGAGYENNSDEPIIVKFNKDGYVMWSIRIYNNDNEEYGSANSIKIDPVDGDLVVLCQTFAAPGFYAEGLIIKIYSETGKIKKVNRLRDLNPVSEQGDVYLYDMTFNTNNELIVVGRKDVEYLEWIIGSSSVLSGSTMSRLVIPSSSIDYNIPDTNGAWSIAGTDLVGDVIFTYINRFVGVTGSGGGTSSSFNIHIVPTTGEYEVWDIVNGGSGYTSNDIITIPGSKLGGTASNNCVLTVGDVDNGSILSISNISGTGSTSSVYLEIPDSVDFSASGTWSIYKSIGGEAYMYTENWERTLGGDVIHNDKFNSVITDADDNIYAVGEAWGGGITSAISNNQMAIVSKFNSNGNHLWTKVLNDQDYDCSGRSIAIFGTNSIVTTHYSAWDGEIIISKLTLDGELLWQKRTLGEQSNVVTNDSGIYVLGSAYTPYLFDNYYFLKIFKLNTDGVMEWNNMIGGKRNYSLSDSTNGFYISGDKIVIAGYTYAMDDYNSNAFIVNLPKDGSLVDFTGMSLYLQGFYTILPTYDTYYDTFTPTIGTHSITNSTNLYFYTNDYIMDNNIDRINAVDNGIVFPDGTKQTSSAGVMPQNYQPFFNDYYLQLSDIGKHIYKDDGDGYSVYIPLNKDVPFPIGTSITVVSGDSWTWFRLDSQDIELWGDGFNSRSQYGYIFYISNNSMATLLKIGPDKWMVSGPNLNYYD